MATDPVALIQDAEQMRLLRDSSAWPVYRRYLESLRDEALKMMSDPRQEDQLMHHWRGVHAGMLRALGIPDEVIAYEKAARAKKPA